MSNTPTFHLESSLRLFFGFLLWGVSATLTFVLLLSLGDGTIFSKVLLGIVAVALEGSKILAWRKGGPSRIYAVALIILSGIASLGTSLQVVEKSKGSFLSIFASRPCFLSIISGQGRRTEVHRCRDLHPQHPAFKSLPADYTTAATSARIKPLLNYGIGSKALIASLDRR